jgi:uncharacterized protein (UPF0371 family)
MATIYCNKLDQYFGYLQNAISMFSSCSIFQIPADTNTNMVEVVTCEAGATRAAHKQQS